MGLDGGWAVGLLQESLEVSLMAGSLEHGLCWECAGGSLIRRAGEKLQPSFCSLAPWGRQHVNNLIG